MDGLQAIVGVEAIGQPGGIVGAEAIGQPGCIDGQDHPGGVDAIGQPGDIVPQGHPGGVDGGTKGLPGCLFGVHALEPGGSILCFLGALFSLSPEYKSEC